jgi:hypothetical protein
MKLDILSLSYRLLQVRVDVLILFRGKYVSGRGCAKTTPLVRRRCSGRVET